MTTVGALVLFAADDGTNGRELWKSDGTALGTSIVTDLNPGLPEAFDPFGSPGFVLVGTDLYFKGNDGASGLEVWKSDGSGAGTIQISDIRQGTNDARITQFASVGTTLFFPARNGAVQTLWMSDGTESGTMMVSEIVLGGDAKVTSLIAVGSSVFFSADDGTTGAELWTSDGTAVGTFRVSDINPGPSGSTPLMLGSIGNLLIFSADDGATGRELWMSDGTELGTASVMDINVGSSSSSPFGGDVQKWRSLFLGRRWNDRTRTLEDRRNGSRNESSQGSQRWSRNRLFFAASCLCGRDLFCRE